MEQMIKRLDDHEERLRHLENNAAEMKYNLLSIEKGQSDLKAMVLQHNKAQTDLLTQLLNKFVDSELGEKKINQKNKWNLMFKLWATIGPILAAIAAYLFKGE